MQSGSEEDKERVEEFRKLFGRLDDASSINSRIWKICLKGLFNNEIEDAENIVQDVALEAFAKYKRGNIDNLMRFCLRVTKTKVGEYRREKSATINYQKLIRDLQNIHEATLLLEKNDKFIPIVQRLTAQISERDRDSIDGYLVLDRLIELIRIEKTNSQPARPETLKTLEYWKGKLKEKINENETKTINLDSKDGEDGREFSFFDYKYISDHAESPEEAVSREQIAIQLMECLSQLPANLEKLVMLRVGEALRFEEIRKITETPIATISNRVDKALIVLRDCLAKKGIKRG